ncbi:DNA-binding transcriptional LysR family regulator [Arthrobacter pascens]|jgi:DNA-binding transcriptional LysR family regulator|uniref:LysR family transcriptional regulator n=1 Tax=Arthrobacter pascens TaxID=1677 RepID=UPI002782A7F6|nr:LysR family transcriptional regulator [Arthrobacter pascens]MDQ0632393.1 DNA-binding transcriptional LysR family regulator [Arthrobacter pascens]
MEIRQLRRFLVLAEELHFGKAAARLHIAQPALSQELKALEKALGLRLVDRTHNHVALTDAGRRLQQEAVHIIQAHDAAAASMEELRNPPSGTLKLGVAVGVAYPLLAELLQDLGSGGLGPGDAAPEVDIKPAAAREGVQKLLEGEFDAVFIHAVPPVDERIGVLTLETEPMGVALPSGSPLAKLAAVSPVDLSGEALIWLQRDGDPDVRERVLGLLVDAGMVPGPHRWSPSIATTMSLVAAGLGVSFKTPHQVVPGDPPGVAWRPFAGVSLPMPTVLVWLRHGASPLTTQLVAHARRYVAKKT